MKVQDRYLTSDDAVQQLHNTYVELDGEFTHLNYSEGWEYYLQIPDREEKRAKWKKLAKPIDIRECELNLQPLELGYVNANQSILYIQRKPLRKWKQGLYVEYLDVVDDNTPQHLLRNGDRLAKIHQAFNNCYALCLFDNDYPTMTRAFVNITQFNYSSQAWSRHWAFRRDYIKDNFPKYHPKYREPDILLEYKGKSVGKVVNGKVILFNKFKYLTETFVEAMINAS